MCMTSRCWKKPLMRFARSSAHGVARVNAPRSCTPIKPMTRATIGRRSDGAASRHALLAKASRVLRSWDAIVGSSKELIVGSCASAIRVGHTKIEFVREIVFFSSLPCAPLNIVHETHFSAHFLSFHLIVTTSALDARLRKKSSPDGAEFSGSLSESDCLTEKTKGFVSFQESGATSDDEVKINVTFS